MRLLFDQNLSPRLKETLRDVYPQSLHVRDVGLQSATDAAVWDFAKEQGLVIVSKDGHFRHLAFTYGHPPKVVWIQLGNCSTREVETLLRISFDHCLDFYRDAEGTFLTLT
jgi:predicted nuclease of predicted toxin-antitoxin system